MTTKYLGDLRTEAQHLPSGNHLITDAPIDNNGRGEAFSPTDLVASALSSCMMTIMGIIAKREGIDISGMTAEVTKVMASGPRRISEISITFSIDKLVATKQQVEMLKSGAITCPVALSLADDLKQTVTFQFG